MFLQNETQIMLQKRSLKYLLRSLRVLSFPLLLAAMVSVALPSISLSQERALSADSWTNSSGDKTINGEFIKLEGVNLSLRMSDGSEKVIPLSKLDDKSRIKARELAKSGAKPSASTSDSIKANGISTNVKFLTPVTFPSSPSAEEFMDIVVRELKNENPMVVWDALPASKQKQVREIVKLASTRIEQRTMNAIKKFRGELLTALKSKKQFVLNSTKLPIPPEQMSVLAGSYDSLVGLLDAYIPEAWMDTSYLQQSEIRDLLATYVERVAAKGEEVKKSLPIDSPFRAMLAQTPESAKVENSGSKEAMVTFVLPGQPSVPVKYVLTEGRWLPELMLNGWDQGASQSKRHSQNGKPKPVGRQRIHGHHKQRRNAS
jgi:hypothetical protein